MQSSKFLYGGDDERRFRGGPLSRNAEIHRGPVRVHRLVQHLFYLLFFSMFVKKISRDSSPVRTMLRKKPLKLSRVTPGLLAYLCAFRNEGNRVGSMAVHVVRVCHNHFVKRESNPRPGATISRTAASLRPRSISVILARAQANISKRTFAACPVSKKKILF